MKFENKGKWVKQINEAQGATLNGTDDIELEFDSRHSKVYITINGDLTYVVDEDKFNDNVSNFIYDEVNKDKTKFNLNWFKHFGKLNRYLRKAESFQKNEGLDKKHIDYLNGRLEHIYDLDGVAHEMLGPVRDYMVKHNIKVADYLPYMPDETKRRITYACRRQNRVPSNKYMKDDIFAGFWHRGKEKALLESTQKNENDLSISAMLDFSLSEENDAVANYEKRAAKCLKHGNIKLANLFKELARDEKVHVAQLTKAKELLGLANNEIEQEGSDEAKEILVDSSQKNEASSLTNQKTKQNAIRHIYNNVNTKGIFRDTDWSGFRKVVDQIRSLGADVTVAPTNDSSHKSGYMVNKDNVPVEKRYDVEIKFKNIDNKEIVIKGQIACQGAGSVKDPLDAYDIVMTLY